jgi:hypothetical protein
MAHAIDTKDRTKHEHLPEMVRLPQPIKLEDGCEITAYGIDGNDLALLLRLTDGTPELIEQLKRGLDDLRRRHSKTTNRQGSRKERWT